ncbi:MAG: Gfo/Idh/MocA family oxidoreductase [Planctomycetales bacterium]|nr:Gfo/Idh/MocA family oxidoreductase [Planctomycetales bacterium]
MTINIGIVGCGRILAAHLQGYRILREQGFDGFRITALCSRNRLDAESYIQRGEGPPQRNPVSQVAGDPLAVGDQYLSDFQDDVHPVVFTDYEEMIRWDGVDAVNDWTSHELHHRVAATAFRHGKHLLTQKPLAVTVAAARQMCLQAEQAGATLAVFENARNKPVTRQLSWLFESGRIGRLKQIQLTNIGNWWAPDLVVAETPWRHQAEHAGGIALDIGVHLFNQFAFLAGDIRSVWGQASVQEPQRRIGDRWFDCDADDTIICGFESEQQVQGAIHLSWSGHGESTMSGNGRGLCFYAERGSVIGDDVRFDDGTTASLGDLYRSHAGDRKELDFPRGIENPFALNQLDWLEAIEQGRAPETSGKVGLRDLAAATAILESSHSGRRVLVDDVAEGRVRDWQRPLDRKHGLL